jgi:hypothetical protein
LGPFHNRPAEWELYQPLFGDSMLELGNKKNGEFIYKPYFEGLGYRHVSVDLNGENGALRMDLTKPLNLGTFDMVTNIGTSEHVERNQEACWRNICEALHVGSVLVSATPAPGHWVWHGYWYPTREFYEGLAAQNGLRLERLYESGESPRVMLFTRMVRAEERPFVMPGGMYRNQRVNKYGQPMR